MDDLNFMEDPKAKAVFEAMLGEFFTGLKEQGLVEEGAIAGVLSGQTIAQVKGLSRDDLEVLYAHGFSMITAGELEKAQDIFMQLCLIDPLEAKNHYCLGVTRQMLNQFRLAQDDFTRFLAMDATNPEGYLRLGECLVALSKPDAAREAFEAALPEAPRVENAAMIIEQAQRSLDLIQEGGKT